MASAVFSYLQHLWPFSILKVDDLKVSIRLVHRLSIPDQTKQFVFAFEEPDSHAVVYILAGQNLSEQSALDAVYLIKEVRPKAVVAHVAPSALAEIQAEEKRSNDDQAKNVPTSSFQVLKQCFLDKFNKQQYETLAGCQVVQEIFGIGFYGHFLVAKRAAEEVNSHFVLLESPHENACDALLPKSATNGEQSLGLHLLPTCLVPAKVPSASLSSKRFCLTDILQTQMVKSLVPSLELLLSESGVSNSISESTPGECQPGLEYQAPPFAQSVYPLLTDLYSIFIELPAIGRALISAQKMLLNVGEGEPVNTHLLSEVQNFRIAIEGLRIALNNAARYPMDKREGGGSKTSLEFSKLSSEEKCHALSAQALRDQARKFGSVVAIVDAGSLAGLRRHWNTSVPQEFADWASQCFIHYSNDDPGDYNYDDDDDVESIVESRERKRLLADKPVVAVGAGATAVLGASSLSKGLPASTLIKFATYKVPVSLKLALAQLQRSAAIGLSKILGPSKLVAPGVSSVGTNTSTLKLMFSAEKIRAVTHSMIASAERTSLLAMRTSFYEIMRRRRVGPLRFTPLATFSCSVAACSGLLVYGDGIECAAESIPSVPMITSLGRGLQSLHIASQEVRQSNHTKIQEALQSLMYNLKKLKMQ